VSSTRRNFWRAVWIVAAIYWVTLFILTHLPPDKIPKTNVSDKTEHLVSYGLLAAALHLSCWPKRWSILKTALLILATCMLYGAFDEITQPYFGRTCDIVDWLADSSGASISILLMSLAIRIARPPATPKDLIPVEGGK
jgi:VanZ family protein